MTASSRRPIRSGSSMTGHRWVIRAVAPRPIVATGDGCRDQGHRRALQSLFSDKLPRADRHHLGLRRRLDAVLPDGHAAARRVDEPASGRAPGGMALRDRQPGSQGSLGWKAASPDALNRLTTTAALTNCAIGCQRCSLIMTLAYRRGKKKPATPVLSQYPQKAADPIRMTGTVQWPAHLFLIFQRPQKKLRPGFGGSLAAREPVWDGEGWGCDRVA